jgi:hypothetical protein
MAQNARKDDIDTAANEDTAASGNRHYYSRARPSRLCTLVFINILLQVISINA